LRTGTLVFGFSTTDGAISTDGSDGLVMLSLDTTDGAGTIVGTGTIAGGIAMDTSGILTNTGSGDLATTRDDRVAMGSGDTGSGAG